MKKRWWWLVVYTIPIVILSLYSKDVKEVIFPPLHIEYGKNTLSTEYSEGMYNVKQLMRLLNRYSKYKVLCMHHMDMSVYYKACKFGNYFTLSPHIEVRYGEEVTVFEKSVSCTNTVKRKRFKCIKLKWMDENMFKLEGDFCGDEAMSMQLAIDEFGGNQHCGDI